MKYKNAGVAVLHATTEHTKEVRAIAKVFGIKGCKLGTRSVMVGRQTHVIPTKTANDFMDALKANKFHIDCESTSRELADKGLFDMIMVYKIYEIA